MLVCFIFSVAAETSFGMLISADGGYLKVMSQADLLNGAGSDYNSPAKTTSDPEVSISISGTTGSDDTWKVYVRRSTDNWPAGVTISVKGIDPGSLENPGAFSWASGDFFPTTKTPLEMLFRC